MLYIILFLHQTTTPCCRLSLSLSCISSFSYIKPQLYELRFTANVRCISSFSYIKPQPACRATGGACVVYHPFPTSNHNPRSDFKERASVVYHPFPTSNHNRHTRCRWRHGVVYHPFPTSNHNAQSLVMRSIMLYIILFLHQTTTIIRKVAKLLGLYIILFLHQTTTLRQ